LAIAEPIDKRHLADGAHSWRHQPDEIAHPAAGLEHGPAGEPHAIKRTVHAGDNLPAGVVRILRGLGCVSPLLWGQLGLELGELLGPVLVVWVERLRNTAPAHVTRQDLLLVDRSGAPRAIQILDQADRLDVRLVLCALATLSQGEVFLNGEIRGLELGGV
jgi:hypothetical protein